MIYYRLLRDNKESGPYSEEEMIAKGFKPYDLLWAEGKTAGWQYPSEMAVFKQYAPIVEEQPFDRFYKKQPAQPSDAVKDNMVVARAGSVSPVRERTEKTFVIPEQAPAAVKQAADYALPMAPGRHIHVAMPAGRNNAPAAASAQKKETRVIQSTPKDEPTAQPGDMAARPSSADKPAALASQVPVFRSVPAEDNHWQSVDHPANKTSLAQPVYLSNGSSYSWSMVMGTVIGIAALLGLGIMIGLSINRDRNNIAFNESLNRRQPSPINNLSRNPVPVPAATPVSGHVQPLADEEHPTVKNKALSRPAVLKTVPVPDNKKEEKTLPPTDNNIVAEKNKTLPEPETVAQHVKTLPVAVAPANIEKSLNLSANDFKTGAFGGISGLRYTLYNGSKLPLQAVEVEVDYIQANNKIYKTEKLLFKDVPAGSQATLDAPASSRGVKIDSRIIKIIPRDPAMANTTARS